ncbi:MAG TPA: 2-succinyl-5-enolpyruvyl-6-hydroxy-3-cyclohexene-1-carboxylic-acid synthase [Thermoleophilaceae bacterium]|nr:2-succinyl-5-enolpyruvyl-6-hydroxy-3-cyclohexene-1-carboxylic-acid synthase [Thermoleophilaceae bacterium]
MMPINRTFAPIQAFVDELARCGLHHAVTCPGSRNAPLILALTADPRLECVSVIDERSAGFVALGIAKASRRPVAVTCTSGTAAANLMPAVLEAREARVPLLVLTADRPPELRDVGAGQSIDQLKLYGSAVKWFCEVGNHEPGRDAAVHHRSLACRAWFTSEDGRPGPVHVNFPLREPLAPTPEDPPLDPADWTGRSRGRPWVTVSDAPRDATPTIVELLEREVREAGRGAIVAGYTGYDVAASAARLAAATGWPLLAEPTSGVRCGPHDRSHVIAHYDVLLRSARFVEDHQADLVIRIGDTPTSKPLRAWLAGTRQIVVDPDAGWHEPTREAERIVATAPDSTCELLAAALEESVPPAPSDWTASWRAADAEVPDVLAGCPDPCEPKAYAALADALPDGALVWVASSMAIRDVETFFPQTAAELRFLSNRGANGIDGTVSSALGASIAAGRRAYLLTGELALLHDVGGLLAFRRRRAELTILCVNNGGGGIFDFLPVSEHAEGALYLEHVVTPSGVNLGALADLAGLPHVPAETAEDIRAAADAPGLIEVRTDRDENVRIHRDLFERVDAALAAV